MALSFAFDPNIGETPETVAQRRALADAISGRIGRVQNVGQGIGDLLSGIAAGSERRAANKAEKASRNTALGDFGKLSFAPQQLAQAVAPANNNVPFASPNGTAMTGFGSGQIGLQLAQRLQKDFGLSPGAAAGFAGNLAHESGNFKTLQETSPTVAGSRGGYGWAQWTGPRRRAFEQWAAQNNMDPSSPDANYGFLAQELKNTPEGAVLAKLKGVNDPAQAAQIVSENFLRPGIPHMGSRIDYANQIAQGMNGQQVASNDPQAAFAAAAPQPAGNMAAPPPALSNPQEHPFYGGGAPAQQMAQAQPSQAAQPGEDQNMQAAIKIMANPWSTQEQKAIAQMFVQRAWQQQDPMYQMKMKETQQGIDKGALELNALRNPEIKPADPYTLSEGQIRFGADNKPIASGGEKAASLPSAVQEYQFAQGQGFKGTFQDWEASKKGGMQLRVDPATGEVTFEQGANIRPMTESQSKDTVFATKARGALTALEPNANALTEVGGTVLGDIPVIGNAMKSDKYQQAEQAGNEFLMAILRKESGAAIGKEERKNYGDFFLPKLGDGKGVLAQKKISRDRAVKAIVAGMTPQAILAQETALRGSTPVPDTQTQPAETKKGSITGKTKSGLNWSIEP
jgi:hypothetical protein